MTFDMSSSVTTAMASGMSLTCDISMTSDLSVMAHLTRVK